MSTAALEQDFTVEGKKGSLACPFSAPDKKDADGVDEDEGAATRNLPDLTPHQSTDPICAAMFEEATSQPANSAVNKCPIRFLDKHSPEEIAHYVKTYKHELPRSHAICVERYQRNEDQVRKLDAKYGNMVSMIEGLGQLHKPMLPVSEERDGDEVDVDASNQRVENWAQEVSANTAEYPATPEFPSGNGESETQHGGDDLPDDHERESHFDRPLKEVRVGESPSRPWGISVPVYEPNEYGHNQAPLSPPPAPVFMPTQPRNTHPSVTPEKRVGKCPFDHTKLAAMGGLGLVRPHADEKASETSKKPPTERPFTPQKQTQHAGRPATPVQPVPPPQPTFINPTTQASKPTDATPQMVFTGPVFIGYPMEQAIQFMQAFQGQQQQR